MTEQKTSLYVPIAILLAGFLVAVGVYLSGGSRNLNDTDLANKDEVETTSTDTFKQVSKDDHILGSIDAKAVIVEYSDTECSFCKRFQTTLQGVFDTYGKDNKVAWVYRHFPLDSIHSKARKEAEATECANELGGNDVFWKYLDMIYANTPSNNGLDPAKLPEFAKTVGLDVTKFNTCLSSGKYAGDVEADFQSGVKMGVRGTPFTAISLKTAVKDDVVKAINDIVTKNGLYDQQNNPLIKVRDDKKVVTTNGALPIEIMKSLIETLTK
ncbi:MAG: DsbA family protein [bacterium]